MKCPQSCRLKINILWNFEINQWQWQEPSLIFYWFVQPRKERGSRVSHVPPAGRLPASGITHSVCVLADGKCQLVSRLLASDRQGNWASTAWSWSFEREIMAYPALHIHWKTPFTPGWRCGLSHLLIQALGGPFIGKQSTYPLRHPLYHSSVVVFTAVITI